jgi:hypothetical protein
MHITAFGLSRVHCSSHLEVGPEAVAIARELRSDGYSLRDISWHLPEAGYLNQNGRLFAPKSIFAMLRGPKASPR